MDQPSGARDLVWDAMKTVAERLNERAQADDRWTERERLKVDADRRRSFLTWTVTEGLYFGNLWTDGFEVVRTRRLLSRDWREVADVATVASRVGYFLRDRPDLTGADWPRT